MDVQQAMFFDRSKIITDWMRNPARKEGPEYTLEDIVRWADWFNAL